MLMRAVKVDATAEQSLLTFDTVARLHHCPTTFTVTKTRVQESRSECAAGPDGLSPWQRPKRDGSIYLPCDLKYSVAVCVLDLRKWHQDRAETATGEGGLLIGARIDGSLKRPRGALLLWLVLMGVSVGSGAVFRTHVLILCGCRVKFRARVRRSNVD